MKKTLFLLLLAASFLLVSSCKKDSTQQSFTSPPPSTEIKVQSITLDNTFLSLKPGETHQTQATLLPGNAWNQTLVYTSSDTSIAKVSSSGLIQAIKTGSATINVVNTRSSITAQCKVTVLPILVNSITISTDVSVYLLGYTFPLKAIIMPTNAANQNITWTSSDPTKVIVDSNGNVTSLAYGVSIITAKSTDGGNVTSNSCTVTVKSN